ncbi:MAG: hypothetical protein MJ175_08395 [Clostridia bacterium]|nr:hypothetical protein [Clostridia bacterium]
MKRCSLLLALIPLLLTAATACGTEAPAPAPETQKAPEAVDTSATDTPTDYTEMSFLERMKYSSANIADNLPETSFDGKTVKIWVRDCGEGHLASEQDGENLNDATYAQKRAVEERFNVKIEYLDWAESTDWGVSHKLLNTNLLSGDYFADIVENWNTGTSTYTSQGFYEDLTNFSCIDTTKPWFFGSEMQMYAYRGHYYIATGFMNTSRVFNAVAAIFFNKDLASTYDMEDLYQTVRDGKWTADHVLSLCKDFYYDVNGDGTADDNDLYGMDSYNMASWIDSFPSFELPLLTMKDDGSYSLIVYDKPDACQKIMDTMRELNSSAGNINGDWDSIYFVQGTTLFGANTLGAQKHLRDAKFAYGILPPFKADENQAEYCTSYLPDPWAIPVSASDAGCAALITAAYAVEGYKTVLPVCYENTIKTKYTTDDESGEMLDLMMKNIRGDGMLLYGDSDYIYTMGEYLKSTKGYGSYFESKEKKLRKSIEKRIAAYEDMLNNAQ